jgi:hypothetical protein
MSEAILIQQEQQELNKEEIEKHEDKTVVPIVNRKIVGNGVNGLQHDSSLPKIILNNLSRS